MRTLPSGETGGMTPCWKWLWHNRSNELCSGFINLDKLGDEEYVPVQPYEMVYPVQQWSRHRLWGSSCAQHPVFVLGTPFESPLFTLADSHELWFGIAYGMRFVPKTLFCGITPDLIERAWQSIKVWEENKLNDILNIPPMGGPYNPKQYLWIADKLMIMARVDSVIEYQVRASLINCTSTPVIQPPPPPNRPDYASLTYGPESCPGMMM